MKKTSKALLLVLCAVLLVTASVMGTMAYLTAKTVTVENTFSVGKVTFDAESALDEAAVNEYGQKLNAAGGVAEEGDTLAARVVKNTYKLIPGHSYTKDPTIHITKGSEACWLFVKVDNGIEAIEDKTAEGNTIATQMTDEGWLPLEVNGAAVDNVFYQKDTVDAREEAKNIVVFKEFILADDAAVENYADAKVNITAYAVQADGFATAAAAWTAANFS